jgi:hypothetical protein
LFLLYGLRRIRPGHEQNGEKLRKYNEAAGDPARASQALYASVERGIPMTPLPTQNGAPIGRAAK